MVATNRPCNVVARIAEHGRIANSLPRGDTRQRVQWLPERTDLTDKGTQRQFNSKPPSASRGRTCRRAGYLFLSIFAVATIFAAMPIDRQIARQHEDSHRESHFTAERWVAGMDNGFAPQMLVGNRVENGALARRESPLLRQADETEYPPAVQLLPGAILVLLVLGVAAYGYRLARRMKRSNSEFASRVAALEESLREAKLRAEQATSTRTQFFAAASHDLRQPLHAILLYLPLLMKRAEKSEDREMLEAIQNSCTAMRSLLDSLLDISRLDAGLIEPQFGPVPLLDIFDRLGMDFTPQAAAKGLQLRVVPTDCRVRSDPALLKRILCDLLANAIRFTRHGKILLGARRSGRSVRIEVWDTGIGLDSEELNHVFDEFYQAENLEQDENPGIGLGLAIARRFVDLLEGHRLSIRSWPGRGSVFAINVPVAEETSGQLTGRPMHPPVGGLEGRRVLLIDDDSIVLEGTEAMLQAWGLDVIAVSSISAAATRITERDALPDMIIADLRLRGSETGLDAVLALNETLQRPVPAIIVTGDTDPGMLKQVAASGMTVLRKPFEPARLKTALTQAMAGEEATCGEMTALRPVAGGNTATKRR